MKTGPVSHSTQLQAATPQPSQTQAKGGAAGDVDLSEKAVGPHVGDSQTAPGPLVSSGRSGAVSVKPPDMAAAWVPTYRFVPAQLYNEKFIPIARNEVLSATELRLISLQDAAPRRVDSLAAMMEGREQYKRLKKSIQQELQRYGLAPERVRFNDATCTVDVNYSLHEIEALLPRTVAKILGKKPRKLAQKGSPMLQSLAPRVGRYSGRSALRDVERALQEHPLPPRPEIVLRSGSASGVLEQFLAQSPGLVVGESHTHAAPRLWLIQNMQTLQANGVTTLYLEHLIENMQTRVLDAYHRAPPGSPMPGDLAMYLAHIGRNHGRFHRGPAHASLAALVQAAQAHGIRVVAVDNDNTYGSCAAGPAESSIPRAISMNHLAMTKISEQETGKWVALIGSLHMNSVHEKFDIAPSFSEEWDYYDDSASASSPAEKPADAAEWPNIDMQPSVYGVAELTGAAAVAVGDTTGPHASLTRSLTYEDDSVRMVWDHELVLPRGMTSQTRVEIGAETAP